MQFDYDLFVIGGGSGGACAARMTASQTDARVALAEEDGTAAPVLFADVCQKN